MFFLLFFKFLFVTFDCSWCSNVNGRLQRQVVVMPAPVRRGCTAVMHMRRRNSQFPPTNSFWIDYAKYLACDGWTQTESDDQLQISGRRATSVSSIVRVEKPHTICLLKTAFPSTQRCRRICTTPLWLKPCPHSSAVSKHNTRTCKIGETLCLQLQRK